MNATATETPDAGYAPVRLVFAALKDADRPLTIYQIAKALKAERVPVGTVSGSLTKLLKAALVVADKSTKPALWRASAKSLPDDFGKPRIHSPMVGGRQRGVRSNGSGRSRGRELLVVLPVGKKETITLTQSDARRLLDDLKGMFGEA